MDQEGFVQSVSDLLAARARRERILIRLLEDDPPVFRPCETGQPDIGTGARLINEFPDNWSHVTTLRTVLSKAISSAWNGETSDIGQLQNKWPQIILSYNTLVAASLASQLAKDVDVGMDIVQPVRIRPHDGLEITWAAQTSDALTREIASLHTYVVSRLLNAPTPDVPVINLAKWALLRHESTSDTNGQTTVTWYTEEGALVGTDSVTHVVRRNMRKALCHLHPRQLDIAGRVEKLKNNDTLPSHVIAKLTDCAPRLNEAVIKALATNKIVGVWLFGYRDLRGRQAEVMAIVRPQQLDVHLCVREGVSDFAIGSKAGDFYYFCPSQVQARTVVNVLRGQEVLSLKRAEVCVAAGYPRFRHRYTDSLQEDVFSASLFVGKRPSPAIPPISEQARRDATACWKDLWDATMPYHGYRRFCISRGRDVSRVLERSLQCEYLTTGSCPSYPHAVRKLLRQGEQLLKHAHELNDEETPMADWDKMLHPIDLKRAREWLGNRVYPYSP